MSNGYRFRSIPIGAVDQQLSTDAIALYAAIYTSSETDLTPIRQQGHDCVAGAIAPVGFDSPETYGGHSRPIPRGFFCVHTSAHRMVGRSGKPSGLPVSVGTGLSTRFGLPPVIDSASGRYIKPTEPIMANNQTDGAERYYPHSTQPVRYKTNDRKVVIHPNVARMMDVFDSIMNKQPTAEVIHINRGDS